jgi:hypothetical protein
MVQPTRSQRGRRRGVRGTHGPNPPRLGGWRPVRLSRTRPLAPLGRRPAHGCGASGTRQRSAATSQTTPTWPADDGRSLPTQRRWLAAINTAPQPAGEGRRSTTRAHLPAAGTRGFIHPVSDHHDHPRSAVYQVDVPRRSGHGRSGGGPTRRNRRWPYYVLGLAHRVAPALRPVAQHTHSGAAHSFRSGLVGARCGTSWQCPPVSASTASHPRR